MKLSTLRILALGSVVSLTLAACGTDGSKEALDPNAAERVPGEGSLSDEPMPADSSGKTVSLDLSFVRSAAISASLSLAEPDTATTAPATPTAPATTPATGIQVSDTTLVTDARMSIAAIKFKIDKDPSAEEKELQEKTRKRDAERIKKEKAEDAEDEATLATEDQKMLLLAPPGDKDAPKAREHKAAMDAKKAERKAARATERKARDEKDAKEDAEADKSLRFKGPFVYDLVKGIASPALPSVKLLDGSYKRIDFHLKPNRTVEKSDALLGNVFTISGNAKIAGADVPFRINYHVAENVRLASGTGVKLEDAPNPVAIAFDVKSWFKDVDFSKATKDASGAIVIDKGSNKELLRIIRKNLKASTRFGKDADKDGQVSAKESVGDGSAAAAEPNAAGE